jgi:hypothetical protein
MFLFFNKNKVALFKLTIELNGTNKLKSQKIGLLSLFCQNKKGQLVQLSEQVDPRNSLLMIGYLRTLGFAGSILTRIPLSRDCLNAS